MLKGDNTNSKVEGRRQKAEDGGRRVEDAEVEEFYMKYCVPRKIELNLAYAARANLWEDIKIILRTLLPSKDRR